ncbi:hypothetical protein [Rhizobium phage RHph_X2_24]|nr:hypothetical protein [Rhizobium phage RHph_X2_24]
MNDYTRNAVSGILIGTAMSLAYFFGFLAGKGIDAGWFNFILPCLLAGVAVTILTVKP